MSLPSCLWDKAAGYIDIQRNVTQQWKGENSAMHSDVMDLEDIMFNEISQAKAKCLCYHWHVQSKNQNK